MTCVPRVIEPHPREWPIYSVEAMQSVACLIADGRAYDYARGEEIAQVEDSFSDYQGGGYSLFVNSGTSAIMSALLALDIGPGDEVICPTTTFVSGVTPVLMVGAAPVLVDGDRRTNTMDPDAASACIGTRTKAILVTHLWGHPADMDRLTQLAERHCLALIEDCSHAHGSRLNGRLVGTFGHAAAFSMGSGKMVSGGNAGMLYTRDREIYEHACLLGHFRQRARISVHQPRLAAYANTGLGANLRGSPIAAVLARSHLDQLDQLISKKRENLERLSAGLSKVPGIVPPWTAKGVERGAWYGYHARFDPAALQGSKREDLIQLMNDKGARVTPATRLPLHREQLFQGFLKERLPKGLIPAIRGLTPPSYVPNCPVSDEIYMRTICFPAGVFYGDSRALVDQYIAAARDASEQLCTAWD